MSSERSVLVVMGVSGSGKTTVGQLVAQALACPFLDADDFHSAAAIEKMRRSEALTAEDRAPWIDAIVAGLNAHSEPRLVLACSALTRAIRARLRSETQAQVRFIYLRLDAATLRARLTQRTGHFAKAGLLESQLDTLEEPHDAVVIDGAAAPELRSERVLAELVGLSPTARRS